jgi:hypothetical protein
MRAFGLHAREQRKRFSEDEQLALVWPKTEVARKKTHRQQKGH